MDQAEVVAKAKHLITQALLSTGLPLWVLTLALDSVKSDLLESLYRNILVNKEGDADAAARPAEQHNDDAPKGESH